MIGLERLHLARRLIRLVVSDDGLGEVDGELRHCKLLNLLQDILLLLGSDDDNFRFGHFRLLSGQWRCAICWRVTLKLAESGH